MTSADRRRVHGNLSRARKVQLPATLTLDEWTRTLADFGGRCAYCLDAPAAVLEHFVPLSRGGGTTAGNCLPACTGCDDRKSAKHPDDCGGTFPDACIARLRSYLLSRSTGQDVGTPVATEVGWTFRLPRDVVDQIHARVAALNTRGQGRWTGNMVVVDALQRMAAGWDRGDE